MQEFSDWLEEFITQGFDGSDLHLTEGQTPRIRQRNMGIIEVEGAPAPTRESLRDLYRKMPNKDELDENISSGIGGDFAVTIGGRRMRANISYQGGQKEMNAALRVLNDTVPPLKHLGLPVEDIRSYLSQPSGIILVTGVTGSGKSTTLASMIMERAKRPEQIRTLENPIEYPLTKLSRDKGLSADIHQAEIGVDVASFSHGLRAALRQDPDVILVGEIRDAETAIEAIRAAQTGHLVLSTLHTRSAHLSVKRLIGMFPGEDREALTQSLAENMVAIISQVLVPAADGESRILAHEIMNNHPASGIASHIRQGNDHQIPNELRQGGKFGMHTLNTTLLNLIRENAITKETALEKTYDRPNLEVGKA